MEEVAAAAAEVTDPPRRLATLFWGPSKCRRALGSRCPPAQADRRQLEDEAGRTAATYGGTTSRAAAQLVPEGRGA